MKLKEILLVIALLLLDLLTKFYFQANLELGQSIPVIGDFFQFTYAINTGAAWSILEGKMIFFYIVTLIMCVFLLVYLHNNKHQNKLERFAVLLMLAGALGNFYDRLAFQYVRDFLDFNIFGYDFPVFNIADSYLTIGVLLLFVSWFILDFWRAKYGK